MSGGSGGGGGGANQIESTGLGGTATSSPSQGNNGGNGFSGSGGAAGGGTMPFGEGQSGKGGSGPNMIGGTGSYIPGQGYGANSATPGGGGLGSWSVDGNPGNKGVVRIVWPGDTRRFPTTDVGPTPDPAIELTFDENTDFSNFNVGDTITDLGGNGTGTIYEVRPDEYIIKISPYSGDFTEGNLVQNEDVIITPTVPPTEPVDTEQYEAVGGAPIEVNVPPFTQIELAVADLEDNSIYFARTQYSTTNEKPAESKFSEYSSFQFGTLPSTTFSIVELSSTPTKVFFITVENVGGSNKYFIDDVQQAAINVLAGETYEFSIEHPSLEGHPFKFYTSANKASEYTEGVTYNDGFITLVAPEDTSVQIHYQCELHSIMGGIISIS